MGFHTNRTCNIAGSDGQILMDGFADFCSVFGATSTKGSPVLCGLVGLAVGTPSCRTPGMWCDSGPVILPSLDRFLVTTTAARQTATTAAIITAMTTVSVRVLLPSLVMGAAGRSVGEGV